MFLGLFKLELTFRPSRAAKHWKKNSVSRLFYLFAHFDLLSTDSIFSDTVAAFLHKSEVWLLNFLRQLQDVTQKDTLLNGFELIYINGSHSSHALSGMANLSWLRRLRSESSSTCRSSVSVCPEHAARPLLNTDGNQHCRKWLAKPSQISYVS